MDERGQVALHVKPEGEEVGDDDDVVGAGGGEAGGGAGEVGGAEFEEGGFDQGKPAGAGESGGDIADGLVGAFNAGAVGKEDVTGGHEYRVAPYTISSPVPYLIPA